MADYQFEFLGISNKQKQALEAYQGCCISIGKLSEAMGLSILDMRDWLVEHHIPQNNNYFEDDVRNG